MKRLVQNMHKKFKDKKGHFCGQKGTGMRLFTCEKGVTVLELAIVLTIIAVMALMISPGLGEWAARYRIKEAAQELADAFQVARLKAISEGVDTGCNWILVMRTLSWKEEMQGRIPRTGLRPCSHRHNSS